MIPVAMTLWQKPILRTIPIFYRQATATVLRRVVFSLLLLWALTDAALTLRDWHRGLPMWVTVIGFFLSFFTSLLFIGLLTLIWDWFVRRFGRATRN
jgi:hypothetical protein